MEFNWINLFNGIIVILMLIPNIVYAVKNKENKKSRPGIIGTIAEQVGRYGCIVLMILPLFTGEFGFSPLEFMFVYLIGNVVLLVLYFVFWILYSKNKSRSKAFALSVIPGLIFINCAVCVKHWALLAMTIVFVVGHVCVTLGEGKN